MKRRGRGEGGITYLESKGVYVASVYVGFDIKGKPKYIKAQRKTKSAAVVALNKLKADLATGKPLAKGQKTVGSWLDEWLEDFIKPHKAPKTYRFYEQMVRLHIRPSLGGTQLRKLDTSTVVRFLNAKRKAFDEARADETHKGPVAGPATLDAIRRTLRAALKKAVAVGYAAYCPVNEATALGKIEHKPAKTLTPEQSAALYKEVAGSPIERLVRFVIGTGLRVGEATGLRWVDVDFERNAFRVENQLQRVNKKLTLRPLKTDKSRREMPLAGMALAAVQDERTKQMLEEIENPMGLVFLNPDGRPFDTKYIDKRLKAALAAAKLPSMGMHGLRHAAATTLLQNGAPMQVVSRLLGHSTITLTANTYGHVLHDAQADALKLLDDSLQKHLNAQVRELET